jgi:hypothetical protein
MIKLKLLLASIAILGVVNSASAQMLWIYSMDMSSHPEEEHRQPSHYYELNSYDPYYKSLVTIQNSLTKFNSMPYIAGENPISFLDLDNYKVLNIHPYSKPFKDIKGNAFKIDDIVVTIKTDKNRKLNLLVNNLSEQQCNILIYAFKNNSFKNIFLNNKIVNKEDKFNCLKINSVELGRQ